MKVFIESLEVCFYCLMGCLLSIRLWTITLLLTFVLMIVLFYTGMSLFWCLVSIPIVFLPTIVFFSTVFVCAHLKSNSTFKVK